jgi:hypothetical protein
MNKSAIEVIRKVWNQEEGVCLVIGEYADAPTAIEIRTEDEASKQWFGELSLALEPEYAKKFGQALIDAAVEKGA